MSDFMKVPCKHCPFRNDIRPYLHPDRAYEIGIAAQNPYNSFPCHKTTEYDDESDDGEMMVTEDSKECAGFLTLRAQEGGSIPEGFTPAWEICYTDAFEMYQVAEEEWNK